MIHVPKVMRRQGRGYKKQPIGCDEVKRSQCRSSLSLSLVTNTRLHARSSLGGDHSQGRTLTPPPKVLLTYFRDYHMIEGVGIFSSTLKDLK